MYIPSAFAETRPDVLEAFIRQHGFGTLVTTDPDAGLCASHLPFLFRDPGKGSKYGTLVSHVARANDQWRAMRPEADVLAIFTGPHAYISPRWYEQKIAVPTWNYTAVHAYGRPRLIDDPDEVRQILSETVAAYEGTGEGTWKMTDLSADYVAHMANAVVAFTIDVTRIEGKFKLNQNRSTADRKGVIAALDAAGSEDAQAVADLMRAGLEDSSPPL